jgi:DNA-binding SARP family transcriptional activator
MQPHSGRRRNAGEAIAQQSSLKASALLLVPCAGGGRHLILAVETDIGRIKMTITMYARTTDRDAVALSLQDWPTLANARNRLRLRGFGPFRVEVDGATVLLPPITSTMLARLVLARASLVDTEDLYRDAWPSPAFIVRRDQRVAVHKRIAELRRCLAMYAVTDHTTALLTERSARTGYRLMLDAGQVDVHTFADLVFRAGAVGGETAVELLIKALAMWTEPPLQGLPDKAFVRDHVARLTRLRDRACWELLAACRALGRTRDALAIFDQLQATLPDDIGLRDLIDQLCPRGRTVTPIARVPLAV